MTTRHSFIKGTFDSACLHHDGDGEWFLIIQVNVDMGEGHVLSTHVKLSREVVKRELLSKVLSLSEGL